MTVLALRLVSETRAAPLQIGGRHFGIAQIKALEAIQRQVSLEELSCKE